MKYALLSVYDKSGISELARFLIDRGYKILSSGGTAKLLQQEKLEVLEVSDLTGFPEILDGRVKTLHPVIHAGILAKRTDKHLAQLKELKIDTIDVVAVNLYPFEQTIAGDNVSFDQAVEQIDIGGPTLLRAAAKNHAYVSVLSDPGQYKTFMDAFEESGGDVPAAVKKQFAGAVFALTARYNAAIADYFDEAAEPPLPFTLGGERLQVLRYGENPHQKAALYGSAHQLPMAGLKQLHGKELSFNNLLDLQAALTINNEFDEPACTIIKHNNPCGIGTGADLFKAHEGARATDPTSAFGGIIALNGELDDKLAEELGKYFTECIVAPSFSQEAFERLVKKKNLRLLTYQPERWNKPQWDVKMLSGGFLLQQADRELIDVHQAKVVTKRAPDEQEWKALSFGWKAVKHVKSNAIVFCAADRTLGIGAGQMSRVDSTEIAIMKSKNAGLSLQGSAVASDAFFPFKDSIEALAEAGATAIIQPGGSIRDEEVIEAADKAGIAMVFSGMRHFKH